MGSSIFQAHPWFEGLDWDNLCQMEAAFIPEVKDKLDTQNFEKFNEVILYLIIIGLFCIFLNFLKWMCNVCSFVIFRLSFCYWKIVYKFTCNSCFEPLSFGILMMPDVWISVVHDTTAKLGSNYGLILMGVAIFFFD